MMTAFEQSAARGGTSRPLISSLVALNLPAETFVAIGDMIVAPTYFGGMMALPAPCACCECPICDDRIDRWHDGYFMRRDGKPRPTEANAAEGWDHRDAEIPSAQIERPEGYYHTALDPEGC